MRCNNVLGLIFAGTLDEKMPDLTSSRTMASVPIWGKYRIIDFVLSNMSNSGINNVGVVATKNYLSLADHLGSGSAYDLSKRRSQLTLLTPYNGSSFSSYPETIYNMHGYIENSREEYVLLSPGNIISNFDCTDLFDFHTKKNADITVIYNKMVVPSGYDRPMTISVDDNGRVNRLFLNPQKTDTVENVVFGAILLKKDLLMQEINQALAVNQKDIKNIIQAAVGKYNVYGFEDKGYTAAITSNQDYFNFNMDLIKKEVRDALFNPQRPIYTKVRDDAPSRYGLTSSVKNSIIAQGCVINGVDSELYDWEEKLPRIEDLTDGMPPALQKLMGSREVKKMKSTFCVWTEDGSTWHCNPMDGEDASKDLLSTIDGNPQSYVDYGKWFYPADLPLEAVRQLADGVPVTKELVAALNPKRNEWEEIKTGLDKIGYPNEL